MKQRNLFPFRRFPSDKPLTARAMRANIRRVYRKSAPIERSHGRTWYADARRHAERLGVKYSVPSELACYVIAALSPNSAWLRNLRDADSAFNQALNAVPARYATYGANVAKAIGMIVSWRDNRDRSYQDILSGNKVRAFASNIAEPKLPAKVTVDFHALSVAYHYRFTAKTCPRISDKLYADVSAAYVAVAREYGLLPQQLQAIVWLTWKRIYRV